MRNQYAESKQDFDVAGKHSIEQVQFNNEYNTIKMGLLTMKDRFKTMWDSHSAKISVSKHKLNMKPPNAATNQAAVYRAAPRQQIFEKKLVQIIKAAVAEPATTE